MRDTIEKHSDANPDVNELPDSEDDKESSSPDAIVRRKPVTLQPDYAWPEPGIL